MRFHDLPAREWRNAFVVGIANGLLLSAVMVSAYMYSSMFLYSAKSDVLIAF